MGFWFNLLFYYDLLVNGRFPQDRWDYDSPILTIISHNPGLYASYSSIYHSMSVCFLLCFSFLRMLNLVRFQRVTTMEFPSHQIQFSTLWRNPWSYNSEYLGKKKLCRVFKIFTPVWFQCPYEVKCLCVYLSSLHCCLLSYYVYTAEVVV